VTSPDKLGTIGSWTGASFVLIVHRDPAVRTETWTQRWRAGDEDEVQALEHCARAWLAAAEREPAARVKGWHVVLAAVGEDAALLAARPPRRPWPNNDLVRFAADLLDAPTAGSRDDGLAEDLRTALATDQLRLVYQPEVDLWTRRIIAAEALVRWQHPTRGLLDPSAFIHVAESSGLIGELGTWVVRAALTQLERWSKLPRGEDLLLRINISPAQIAHGDVVGLVVEELRSHQIKGARLCIEITETVMPPDFAQVSDTINELRASGVSTAIDDWGTGYSRIDQLRLLPVDTVKLDRSYVENIDTDTRGAAIVRALIGLAHSLDLVVIAEGVETEGEVNALLALGCSRAQGHLFGQPVTAEEFEGLISAT
jgi:EAL domain-containing protein (putative c-di-GMP-specific phosphodiesterase class I)